MDGMKRIVVGVDGSPASTAALAWAVRRAKVGKVHERFLRTALEQVGASAEGADIEQRVPIGDAGPVVAELSKDADVLVLGAHMYRKAGLSVFGSVAAHCLRHTRCPVVLVPREGGDER